MPSPCATASSVTRSSHRRRVAGALVPSWCEAVGGRCVISTRSLVACQQIAVDYPVVRGRCTMQGCPGCHDEPCVGRFGCVWRSDVAGNARLRNALEWHAQLCDKLTLVPEAQRKNHIRVVCLLAVVIQACASDSLWTWLMDNLRPVPSESLRSSTAGFGARFGSIISAPPAITSADAWRDRMTELLMRLQTNLFYIDERTIGIYPLACQLEHSCRPNASVVVGADAVDPVLSIVAGDASIPAGARVSFSYITDGALAYADSAPLTVRRQRIMATLGFECRCSACESEVFSVER